MPSSAFQFTRAPQLIHRPGVNGQEHFGLSYIVNQGTDNENSYKLKVRVYWDDKEWNHYEFIRYDMGDEIVLYTQEEYNNRVQAIRDNEGDEAAAEWVLEQREVAVMRASGYEPDLKAALIRRWEAMCELVSPHVTF